MLIEVPEHACPHCGKMVVGLAIKGVTDVPAVPAERHYEIATEPRKGSGGLFDKEGASE